MTHRIFRHSHRFVVALTMALATFVALAQTGPTPMFRDAQPGQVLQWAATSTTGQPVHHAQLLGRVQVVFVWSTDCPVCRSALPELRANAAGWKDKPFTLVTLNVDPQQDEWRSYESLVQRTAMPPGSLQALWVGAQKGGFRLPLTLVINPQGKVVARYEGRMAAQAWDGVAELLL